VLTSDPRIVDGATPVPRLTFEEATELAFFGATVLHPLAMQPAWENGHMGVRVKNSYNRCGARRGGAGQAGVHWYLWGPALLASWGRGTGLAERRPACLGVGYWQASHSRGNPARLGSWQLQG
jgi:hypothetical protein